MKNTSYALESPDEFARLESQAAMSNYDYKKELQGIPLPSEGQILDAGCGSGVVSRYLAERCTAATVTGYDFSDLRVSQPKGRENFTNLRFEKASLERLPIESDHLDLVVCRFVLEHLSQAEQKLTLNELFRCLNPGGKIVAIDVDGWFHNLYPSTPWIDQVTRKFDEQNPLDLRVGRKIPTLLGQAGFEVENTRIDLMHFEGEELENEKRLIESRIAQAYPFLCSFLGSENGANRFRDDIFKCLDEPNAVLFYAKFIVTALKPTPSKTEPKSCRMF